MQRNSNKVLPKLVMQCICLLEDLCHGQMIITLLYPVDSLNDEYDAYASMTALKKVSTTDVSHAIIRRDWTSGTVYDEYRHNYTSTTLQVVVHQPYGHQHSMLSPVITMYIK